MACALLRIAQFSIEIRKEVANWVFYSKACSTSSINHKWHQLIPFTAEGGLSRKKLYWIELICFEKEV